MIKEGAYYEEDRLFFVYRDHGVFSVDFQFFCRS